MIKTQQDSAKKHRVPWRDFFIAIGIFVLVIIGFIFYISYEGDEEPIRKVANQLKVDSDWKLVSEKVVPPRNMCVKACPSLSRAWDTNKQLNLSEFESLLQRSGWQLPVTKKCDISTLGQEEGVPVCAAEGIMGEYYVYIRSSKSDTYPQTNSLELSIRGN